MSAAQQLGTGMAAVAAWLVLLFVALGTVADEFFVPALAVIADVLGMSDSVAGVTLLALGNGAPDISACYAAFTSGNTALAVSGVFGAGLFVTNVVLGAVLVTVPFTLARWPFVRDVACYLAAVGAIYAVLFTGEIALGEAIVLLVLYLLYVLVVVLGIGHAKDRQNKTKGGC